ncbi:MAG: ABC transporter ATP-binding protein [Dehalococcoidales bacterium]|nr:ABC transporter ATP-binding protein [Dehalococcoidales bacterium]
MLKLSDVETSYGKIKALKGVSMEVPERSIVALLGANGAGKTTVLRTISGVVHPLNGTIELWGKRIDRVPAERIVGMGVAHVPEGRHVFAGLSVLENLKMGAYGRKDKSNIKGDLDRVTDYFPILGKRRSQPAGTLSGGEQQMLAISRALMARPKLLLLDEPSLGIAPKVITEIFSIIRTINVEEKTTILLVEQNAFLALAIAHYGATCSKLETSCFQAQLRSSSRVTR